MSISRLILVILFPCFIVAMNPLPTPIYDFTNGQITAEVTTYTFTIHLPDTQNVPIMPMANALQQQMEQRSNK